MPVACLFVFGQQMAAMTERGQLATEEQRRDMQLLVDRFEELKVEEEPYKDENMVGYFCCFRIGLFSACVDAFS